MANILNSIIPGYDQLVLDESFLQDEMKSMNLNFNSIQDRLSFRNRVAGAGKFTSDSLRIKAIENINKTFNRIPVTNSSGNSIIVDNTGTNNSQFYQNTDILETPIPGYEDRLATPQFVESEMAKRNWKFLNQANRNSFINFIMGPSKVINKGKALENLQSVFARVPVIIDGGNNQNGNGSGKGSGSGSGDGDGSGSGNNQNDNSKSSTGLMIGLAALAGAALFLIFRDSEKEERETPKSNPKQKGIEGLKPTNKPIKALVVKI